MSAYSPAPWHVDDNQIIDAAGATVAFVLYTFADESDHANARLMGHSDLHVTQGYVAFDMADMRRKHEAGSPLARLLAANEPATFKRVTV